VSMLDYYQPQPSLGCPACAAPLSGWQGKDGPCGLFVWRQGASAPIDQVVSDDARLEPAALASVRLPASFLIYAPCCSRDYMVEARGEAPGGVWASTELITAANATQRKEETRAAFSARLKWLSQAAV
jgi:hypothetical protein